MLLRGFLAMICWTCGLVCAVAMVYAAERRRKPPNGGDWLAVGIMAFIGAALALGVALGVIVAGDSCAIVWFGWGGYAGR